MQTTMDPIVLVRSIDQLGIAINNLEGAVLVGAAEGRTRQALLRQLLDLRYQALFAEALLAKASCEDEA
jgi:hypothetical protein